MCMPAAQTRLLVGSDNVDRWSSQPLWDAVLQGVQIVVSTHAVLADALTHGFVRIDRLALLIYDEGELCERGPHRLRGLTAVLGAKPITVRRTTRRTSSCSGSTIRGRRCTGFGPSPAFSG